EAFGDYYNAKDKYIGIDKELADEDRIVFIDVDTQLDEELYIYSGSIREKVVYQTPSGLKMKKWDVLVPDFFDHEIYLMINEGGKRVLISGCSHKGILNIVEWFRPDVLIGGFHFSKLPLDDTLKGYAELLGARDTTYYTCHCTGTEQFEFMKQYMKNLRYLSEGMSIEI
ncbi:MAG: MBL fold metallo-hydrolase, partial [Firmicutes bacterium]|nr:MBL fold metallo-hydrolase [Bacillota bacterium]